MKAVIAVIGGHRAEGGLLAAARQAGRLVAEAGAVLITGGREGIMQEASRGASEAGGLVLGILPGDDRTGANPYVTVAIATGFGMGRNVIIARTADALIAIGGQYGTLSEIAYALQLGKPVIGIGTWEIEGVIRAGNAADAVELALKSIAPAGGHRP